MQATAAATPAPTGVIVLPTTPTETPLATLAATPSPTGVIVLPSPVATPEPTAEATPQVAQAACTCTCTVHAATAMHMGENIAAGEDVDIMNPYNQPLHCQ